MSNLMKIISSVRILNEPYSSVNNFLCMLLGTVQAISGQIIESAIFDVTLKELIKELRSNYKCLTLLEVEYALINGAKGRYGDFYGLNLRTFIKWLDNYQFSPERLEAINKKNKIDASKQITIKGSITQEESNQMAVNKALDDFSSYKARKSIIDLGHTSYSFLTKIGLISLSYHEKWALYHEAEKLVSEKIKSGTKSIYEITEMTIREKQSHQNEIIGISKNLALKKYFENIIEENIDFEKLLKESI